MIEQHLITVTMTMTMLMMTTTMDNDDDDDDDYGYDVADDDDDVYIHGNCDGLINIPLCRIAETILLNVISNVILS